MAIGKRINDNYIHNCGLEQTKIDTRIMTISKMNFTSEQVVAIIEFFLFLRQFSSQTKKTIHLDLSRSVIMDGSEHRQ